MTPLGTSRYFLLVILLILKEKTAILSAIHTFLFNYIYILFFYFKDKNYNIHVCLDNL